jgi:hypothetical protein
MGYLALQLFVHGVAAFQFNAAAPNWACKRTSSSISMSEEAFAGQTKSSSVAAAAVAELDEEVPWFEFGESLSIEDIPEEELEAIFYQYDRVSGAFLWSVHPGDDCL